ncbi:MAG: succinyl-diaminopimelate desuccinylase [bacterium]|nr:succinyl-diaminopimelate desuccinylase [bacterium]
MDLAKQTLDLVKITSPTGHEGEIADYLVKWIHDELGVPYSRQRNNIMVLPPQTEGRPLIGLFGHIDTVPPPPNLVPEIRDGRLYGCGSTDMKSGLALMMQALRDWEKLSCNLVGIFYEAEEGADENNGLRLMMDKLPPIDFALVLEPTNDCISAGCLGGLQARVIFEGKRAHSARPWLGQNAIYRALPALTKLRDRPRCERVVDGLTFYEVMTTTMARTENAANVVPDRFELNVNVRFAPDRTPKEAEDELKRLLGDLAEVEIRDIAEPGKVCVTHPLIQSWIDKCSMKVEPKQAWTDLARLTAHGIPAVNFGPGNPQLAHQVEEYAEVSALEEGYKLLYTFLTDICAEHPKKD